MMILNGYVTALVGFLLLLAPLARLRRLGFRGFDVEHVSRSPMLRHRAVANRWAYAEAVRSALGTYLLVLGVMPPAGFMIVGERPPAWVVVGGALTLAGALQALIRTDKDREGAMLPLGHVLGGLFFLMPYTAVAPSLALALVFGLAFRSTLLFCLAGAAATVVTGYLTHSGTGISLVAAWHFALPAVIALCRQHDLLITVPVVATRTVDSRLRTTDHLAQRT